MKPTSTSMLSTSFRCECHQKYHYSGEKKGRGDGTQENCDLLYLVLWRLAQLVTIALNWFRYYSRSGNHYYYFNNIGLFGGYRKRVCIWAILGPTFLYYNHICFSLTLYMHASILLLTEEKDPVSYM